jgi:hypothetical protein
VAGAESYVAEVCRDPGCGELVERATGVTATTWRSPALPAGDYHWRITARSPSGLDGYPGEAARFSIRSGGLDQVPPTGTIRVVGPSIQVGGKLWFGPAARVEVTAVDDGSGLEGWTPAVDGQEVGAAALAGPWSGGEHRVTAAALDLCGNRGPLETIAFSVDAEPPTVRWEMGSEARGERPKGRFGSLRRARPEDLQAPGLSWPLGLFEGRLRWNPAWATASPGTVHETFEILSDLPQAFLRVEGVRLVSAGGAVPMTQGPVLLIDAQDAATRVERMVLRTRTTAKGPVLEVEAVDGVGNSGKLEWRLEPSPP